MGREDPLEKGMATHSSILAWKNPIEREDQQATVHGIVKSWTCLKQLSMHTCYHQSMGRLGGNNIEADRDQIMNSPMSHSE